MGSAGPLGLSIYAAREAWPVLAQTLRCALAGVARRPVCIDVIVNGNTALAHEAAAACPSSFDHLGSARLRIWNVAFGDKANAWNQYVHTIAPAAEAYVFIDGYARVRPDAIERLVCRLQADPQALAASGLPQSGRSAARDAARMQQAGGMHGNLYALKASALLEIRRSGFRLPLALYRTDGTLGAALGFGMNLFPRVWRPKERIVFEPLAKWDVTGLRWWRPADLRTQARRVLRQAQGQLENEAVKDHFAVRGLPFQQLPDTAPGLVHTWMERCPAEAGSLLRRAPLVRRALRQMQQPRDWALAAAAPQLAWDSSPTAG